jgi:hypothetical protein
MSIKYPNVMKKNKGIWILTGCSLPDSKDLGEKHGYDTGANYGWLVDESHSKTENLTGLYSYINTETLKQGLTEFLDALGEVFSQVNLQKSQIHLNEIEVSVEIGAEGRLALLGSGIKAGNKGSLKLKFTYKQD